MPRLARFHVRPYRMIDSDAESRRVRYQPLISINEVDSSIVHLRNGSVSVEQSDMRAIGAHVP